MGHGRMLIFEYMGHIRKRIFDYMGHVRTCIFICDRREEEMGVAELHWVGRSVAMKHGRCFARRAEVSLADTVMHDGSSATAEKSAAN